VTLIEERMEAEYRRDEDSVRKGLEEQEGKSGSNRREDGGRISEG